MKDRNYRLFRLLSGERAPAALMERISKEIATLERRAARLRYAAWTVIGVSFLALLYPALGYLGSELSGSSFLSFASLAAGGDIALLTSSEFLLSLVESVPLLSITFLTALLFALLFAVRLVGVRSRTAVRSLSMHAY